MADGRAMHGSSPAMRRNPQSADLAHRLSTVIDGEQENCSNHNDEHLTGFISDVVKHLQSMSRESVVPRLLLVAEHSACAC